MHDFSQRNFKASINIGRMTCGLSTGDMADDEREDSSEPEPDYDDRDSGKAIIFAALYCIV